MSIAIRRPCVLASIGMTIAAIAAIASAAHATSPLRFARAASSITGGIGGPGWHETSTATADFNGDGRPDVVVADMFNPIGGGPILMLNRGDGTFAGPGARIFIAPEVGTLLAGDVNGDGKADLVATNDLAVYVRLGNGNGTFRTGPTYFLPQGFQNDAVLADFDRDGNLDVVVKNFAGVQTLLGNGDGSFRKGPFSIVSGAFSPALSAIDVANFNRDGIPDLAAADAATQRVFALKGHGDGSFSVLGSGISALVPATVAAGDFDGDGIDDVVALNEFNVPGTSMAVLFSNGAGGFEPATYLDGGFNPACGSLADANGDGRIDVISSDVTGSALVVQLSDGARGFRLGGKFPVSGFPQTPVSADFDGDGRLDLAAAGAATGPAVGVTSLSILLQAP